MATPAAHTPITQGIGLAGPGEPVPVAFVGRTSTLELQDPVASLRRQIRASTAALPAGWFIAAWYWDIESGGLDLEARSQGEAFRRFAAAGIPRDGGMADLLAEAASPVPRFAAVICEDIERSGRDTFNALKLEKKLQRQGIAVFATDEPILIDGVNATTVLVRRVKQGVAMVGVPRRSMVRQVKISATTGARSGSRARRVLVRPWLALTGTGCGIRSAR